MSWINSNLHFSVVQQIFNVPEKRFNWFKLTPKKYIWYTPVEYVNLETLQQLFTWESYVAIKVNNVLSP